MFPFLAVSAAPAPLPNAPPLPTFAPDFYVGALQTATRVSGAPYSHGGEGKCCATGERAVAGEVGSIETLMMGSDTYEQGSMQRTRLDSGRGSIVTWFGDVMRQMAVVQSNGTAHKWACAVQCPLNGTFEPSVKVGNENDPPYSYSHPRPTLLPGTFTQPAAIGGASKTCERWRWGQFISVIPMALVTAYVDTTTATLPSLFGIAKRLIPIHGWENVSFVGYQPGNVSEDHFDIDPASIAACPESAQCFAAEDEWQGLLSTSLSAARRFPDKVSATAGSAKATAGSAKGQRPVAAPANAADPAWWPPPTPPPNITFVGAYTATEVQEASSHQGALELSNGDLCCGFELDSAPHCEVQIAKTSGVRYMDVPNQRTRYEGAGTKPGSAEIADYTVHKHMFVSRLNGSGVTSCLEYCPIDPKEVLHNHPFGYHVIIRDLGPAPWAGNPNRTVEHYQWTETMWPTPIPLSTVEFFADISNPRAAVPIRRSQAINPLGLPTLGVQNLTWTQFKPGTPDEAKFDIHGVDTCPLSTTCKSPKWQQARLALGMHHTFARYMDSRGRLRVS